MKRDMAATPLRIEELGVPPPAQAVSLREGEGRSFIARRWRALCRFAAACGVALIAVACLLHPWIVERYVSTDQHLQASTRRSLYGLEAFLASAGALVIWLARSKRVYTKRRGQAVIRLSIVSATILGSLLGMELALRAVHYYKPIQAERHYFFSYDEVLGWKHRPDRVSLFKGHRVQINHRGVRDDEITDQHDSAGARILLLGDSQLFGDGVSFEETFSERLENIRGVQAINAGVIGYGTDQELLYFEREGASYRPTLTIVCLNAYDLLDNISTRIRSGYSKPVFELAGDGLRLANVPVPAGSALDRTQLWLRGASHLYTTVSRTMRGTRTRSDPALDQDDPREVFPADRDFDRSLEVTRRILGRLAEYGRRLGSQMMVIYLPYQMDFGGEERYRSKSSQLAAELGRWGREAGFHVLDLRPALRAENPRALFLDTMHLSAGGHRRVAATLERELIGLNLIPREHAR